MIPREFRRFEYKTVIEQAGQGGWLALLLEAHLTPCTRAQATALLNALPRPKRFTVRFNPGRSRGWARWSRTNGYSITLPDSPRNRRLRVGLVLHEMSHIWKWGNYAHGPVFCKQLRQALRFNWKGVIGMATTSSYRAIYDRHRGPYSLVLVRETIGPKGKVTQDCDRLRGPFSAEDAHEESRLLVNCAKDNVVSVSVYSETEGQYIGAFYKKGEHYKPWHEEGEDGRLELPDERPAPTLLQGKQKPVQKVDDPLDADVPARAASVPDRPVRDVPDEAQPKPRKSAKLPGDRFPVVRGKSLELDLGNAERWPKSEAAQIVRAFYEEPGKRATPAEVVAALGDQLKALGVEHPASLVSRLKQGGFLKVTE